MVAVAATVGVLCGRMRVEEKLLVAALAEAGLVAEPVVPTGLPLPPSRAAFPLPPAPAIAGGPATDLLIDRYQGRAAGAALIAASRAIGAVTVDAGLAATGDRLAVATALAAAGVARPNTHLAWSAEAALAAVAALGCPATLLPLAFSSPPAPLHDTDAAEAVIEHRAVLGHGVETLGLVQSGVVAGRSVRVVVVDGEAVAGSSEVGPAGRGLASLAAHALGARILGVEIAETERGLVVWDIQPVPDFRAALPFAGKTVAEAVAAMALRLLGLAEPAHHGAAPHTLPAPAIRMLSVLQSSANGHRLSFGSDHVEEVRDGLALLA